MKQLKPYTLDPIVFTNKWPCGYVNLHVVFIQIVIVTIRGIVDSIHREISKMSYYYLKLPINPKPQNKSRIFIYSVNRTFFTPWNSHQRVDLNILHLIQSDIITSIWCKCPNRFFWFPNKHWTCMSSNVHINLVIQFFWKEKSPLTSCRWCFNKIESLRVRSIEVIAFFRKGTLILGIESINDNSDLVSELIGKSMGTEAKAVFIAASLSVVLTTDFIDGIGCSIIFNHLFNILLSNRLSQCIFGNFSPNKIQVFFFRMSHSFVVQIITTIEHTIHKQFIITFNFNVLGMISCSVSFRK